MAKPRIITLTTDFGYQDPFVGILKGILLGLNSTLRIVDISHGVPPQDILAGALVLNNAVSFFPPGTIHIGIVDPGVGSERRPLLIEAGECYFVGPDNGLFSLALQGIDIQRVIQLTNDTYHLKPTSTTFHGRDIFAPVAAHLSLGTSLAKLGVPINDITTLHLPHVVCKNQKLYGEVIYTDNYGNLITNIKKDDMSIFRKETISISIGRRKILGLASSYTSVSEGKLVALINSWSSLEIAVRNGSAEKLCRVYHGAPVVVSLT